MVTITIALDFELIRQILFRLEDVLDSNGHSIPSDYMFDDYHIETISHNIQRLSDAGIVFARVPQDWHRYKLRSWPTGFKPEGWRFLAAAKDREAWDNAVAAVKSRKAWDNSIGAPKYMVGDVTSLKALKRILL